MRSTLATKFSVTILGVVVLAVLSSLVTLYFAWRVNMRLEEAEANWDDHPGIRVEEADVIHWRKIIERIDNRIHEITWVVGISGVLTLVLGGVLLWLFFYRVLFPLRGMVADAQLYRGDRHAADKGPEEDELRIMGNHLRNLMSDVSDTRSRLERSRNQLLVAEKLASVGKLAASVAHEIRNPLTAMKMWLFSIREAVQGNADLERKLGIISEEIARLESIVRDFLEFSRPRTLDCRPQDVGAVIDQTLELLGPRFQGEKITISYLPRPALPPVMADAAQLKQVLLNLLGNAADAMPGGGEIRITSNAEKDADGRPMVVVRICDTGPGMPQDIQAPDLRAFLHHQGKRHGTGPVHCRPSHGPPRRRTRPGIFDRKGHDLCRLDAHCPGAD